MSPYMYTLARKARWQAYLEGANGAGLANMRTLFGKICGATGSK